jgi:hypothetical protein
MKAVLKYWHKAMFQSRYVVELSIPHLHLDDQELPYEFRSNDLLMNDFHAAVSDHLGVKL